MTPAARKVREKSSEKQICVTIIKTCSQRDEASAESAQVVSAARSQPRRSEAAVSGTDTESERTRLRACAHRVLEVVVGEDALVKERQHDRDPGVEQACAQRRLHPARRVQQRHGSSRAVSPPRVARDAEKVARCLLFVPLAPRLATQQSAAGEVSDKPLRPALDRSTCASPSCCQGRPGAAKASSLAKPLSRVHILPRVDLRIAAY
jgi:hypothetical protein